jgi:hypothetical protein
MVMSGPFSVGDSLKKVEKAWGSPEDLSTVAANQLLEAECPNSL